MPRISVVSIDRSPTMRVDTPVKGFFSIKAPKGTKTPRYFPANSEDLITYLIGTPSRNYPAIKEVIDFNSEFGVWVSAPEGIGTNYYGGAYFTKRGWIAFHEVEDGKNPNFRGLGKIPVLASELINTFDFGVCFINEPWFNDEAITTFGLTGSKWESLTFVNTGGDRFPLMVKNDASYLNLATTFWNVSAPEAVLTYLDGTTEYLVGFITSLGSSKKFHLVKTIAPSSEWFTIPSIIGGQIEIIRNVQDITIFFLSQKYPTSYKLKLTLIGDASSLDVSLAEGLTTFHVEEEIIKDQQYASDGPFTISVDPNKKDGFNVPLFIEKVITEENMFLYGEKVNDFPTQPSELMILKNAILAQPTITVWGSRAIDSLDESGVIASLNQGFLSINKKEFEEIRLIIDTTGDLSINSTLANLRNGRFKYTQMVQPINRSATTIAQLKTSRNSYAMNEGFAYCLNDFLVKESYTGTKFWSPLVGHYARKLARALRDRYGGWATMYYDSNGLGGELGTSVLEEKFSFTEDDLDEFDRLACNPIIKDPRVGPMVTSQRSGKSPLELSDLSWLGHSMAFDLLKYEIINNVMIPQIGKPNEPFWQGLRAQQINDILAPRLNLKVFSEAKVEVAKLNTDAVKAQRKFIIGVAVKVTPFSEWVELQFTNVGQSTVVDVF